MRSERKHAPGPSRGGTSVDVDLDLLGDGLRTLRKALRGADLTLRIDAGYQRYAHRPFQRNPPCTYTCTVGDGRVTVDAWLHAGELRPSMDAR